VKGPKGELTNTFNADMIINVEGNVLTVSRPSDEANHRALHGLTRTLIANMVEGVEKGFSKELEVNGVGYRAEKKGNQLVMRLGYSHEVFVDEIPGITVEVPSPNKIIVHGIDKQVVGQFAAEVRGKRPPEPYKGKGIKYSTEVIRRKVGKTGGKK
jgi:large subunit ribosomal protein L6